jgi:agmatine/peptidylarginine deiminase
MLVTRCMPADFEEQSAIMLGCNELVRHHPQVLVDIVGALVDKIPLLAIINSEEERRDLLALLCDWGLPAHYLHFVSMPVAGMWVRDYGPSFVRKGNDIVILDPDYIEPDRRFDDQAPSELAALLRVTAERVPLLIEGGNLLSNGRGICLTSASMMHSNVEAGLTRDQTMNCLCRAYGFSDLVVSLKPLIGEPTKHIDMFAAFVSPSTVLLGAYDPKVDPDNARRLDEAAAYLERAQTREGRLRVVRIPMPSNTGGVWRTYTNVIFANGTLLMPTYSDVDRGLEREAMNILSRELPGWEIIGVDCTTLIRQWGALRCVSVNIPWLDDRFSDHLPHRRTGRDTLVSS